MKEFFTRQIFINSLVFAMPVGLLMLWRASYIGDIDFLSPEAFQLYCFFVLLLSFLYLLIFFVLFLLGRRRPED